MRRMHANAWTIARASWRVLSTIPWLPVFAVVAGVLSLGVGVGVLVGGHALVDPGQSLFDRPRGSMWLVYGAAGISAGWVAAMTQGVIIAAAGARMAGHRPTPGTALRVARRRLGSLFAWAVLDTAVASALEFIRQRVPGAGGLIAAVGRIGFNVVSFVALPVIVFEDVGAAEAVRRSARLLRAIWGENLTFNLTLTAVSVVLITPAIVFAFAMGVTGALPLVASLVVALGWIAVASGLLSAFSAVFRTALYRWARDLPISGEFAGSDMEQAFATR